MTLMPGAVQRPIRINQGGRRKTTTALIYHVAASESASLFGWFTNPTARASSHLYVARDGTIEQYVDLDMVAWTSGAGNARSIGVETQGMGDGEWTPQQVAALAKIAQFVHARYGVPLDLMADSRPTTHGVGYHRLGVDPWRVSDGEKWSASRGKICPGPDRIAQMPAIIAAAKTQPPTPVTPLTPVAPPTPKDGPMAYEYTTRSGQRVEVHVAAAFDKMAAAFKKDTGCDLLVTSGTRTRQEQTNIFLSRYVKSAAVKGRKVYDKRYWGGSTWYRVSASGAVGIPGTSNHEEDGPRGPRALDVRDSGKDAGVTVRGSARDHWMSAHAKQYGFDNAGYNFGEAWHKEFTGTIGRSEALKVDGRVGPATFARARSICSASKDVYMIRYLQQQLSAGGCVGLDGKPLTIDGTGLYPNLSATTPATNTCAALQRALGFKSPDGKFTHPVSESGKAWQRVLNAGRLY